MKAQALERSSLWREISRNHLSGRTGAFFCYGDDGANAEDGAGKPYADDQAHDMTKEREGMAAFDDWVRSFVTHVEKKGIVAGTKEAERSAQPTTNQDKKKVG